MKSERDDTPVLITEAAPSYEAEHDARKRKYLTMMALRMPCLILAGIFLDRLKTLETCASSEIDFATAAGTPAFDWRNGSRRSF